MFSFDFFVIRRKRIYKLLVITGDWPKNKEEYALGRVIGVGATAIVNAAFCKSNGEACAIKRINMRKDKTRMIALNEIKAMKACNHENIVKLFTSFKVKEEVWLVERLAEGGSMLDIIKHKMKNRNCSHGVFSEEIIATVLKQVLEGLVYLHSNGIIHRDIKAANIFVDKNGTVQIGDLGLSTRVPLSVGSQPKVLHHFAGTSGWMAPEVKQNSGYDFKADVWSFGITTIELATGRPPHQSYVRYKALKGALENKPASLDIMCNRENWYKRYGKSMRNMIAYCLKIDPEKRPTAAEVLNHPFFKIAQDKEFLVENLIKWAPVVDLPVQTFKDIILPNESSEQRQPSGLSERQSVSIDRKVFYWKDYENSKLSSLNFFAVLRSSLQSIKLLLLYPVKIGVDNLLQYIIEFLLRRIDFSELGL